VPSLQSTTQRLCDPRSHYLQQLKQAWAEFLGQWTWEWFCTLTFVEDRVHPERADKCFRVWLARVNEAAYGKRWRRQGKGVTWARGAEFQRRGSIHFHVLLFGVGALKRLAMMDEWAKLAGWPAFVREEARPRPQVRLEVTRRKAARST
jgi:hypothetical protein